MVEFMLSPKNKTANAIEFKKIAFAPLPSAPNIRVMTIDDIKAMQVLIICAPKLNDILFLMDKQSIFLFPGF